MQIAELQDILLLMLTDVAISLCIIGSIFLFIRGKNNRARKMLAYTMLIWGVCSIARAVFLHLGYLGLLLHPLRIVGVIGGNFFIILLMFFPLEVLLPGWLNLKRLFYMTLPTIILSFLYVIGLTITGQEIEEFDSFTEFLSSITHFNVWFRLMFILLIITYNIFIFKLIYNNEKKYLRWKNDNYADVEYLDMSWMRFYSLGTILIFSVWLLNVFVSSPWNFIVHTIVVIVCFTYFIYKGLFYESAYPEDYFKDVETNPLEPDFSKCDRLSNGKSMEDETETISFEVKMPEYVDLFKTWMEKEQPYLYRDFKLTDVARVLPLNRSYLSRVFNEGLGMNFCQIVRKYRIEASKKLLQENPDMAIYTIAEQCGFSSDTTFIRAFQIEMGITPLKYRSDLRNSNI